MKKITILILVFMLLAVCVTPYATLADTVTIEPSTQAPMIDISQIVISVLVLIFNFLLAWVAKVIVPPVREWLKTRTSAEQRNAMWDVIVKLVEAAEQIIGSGNGQKKLQYVKEALHREGYTVDYNLIEAAVKEMNDTLLYQTSLAFDDIVQVDIPDDDTK